MAEGMFQIQVFIIYLFLFLKIFLQSIYKGIQIKQCHKMYL